MYTIVYFPVAGRAELTKWIFAYAGIEYKDDIITKEDWPKRKASK